MRLSIVSRYGGLVAALMMGSLAAACDGGDGSDSPPPPVADLGSDGPVSTEAPVVHAVGDATSGRQVFRLETFGNEGFWTDAMKLQQGMMAAGLTPLRALQLGLNIDIEAVPAALQAPLMAELRSNLSPASAPLLNNPDTFVTLINANAVIGLVARDSNADGMISIRNGDKTGASCALCHTATDGAAFNANQVAGATVGSVGRRLDGRATHSLNFGGMIALAQNTRAYYPVLQLTLRANNNMTLGRASTGLTPQSTEAEVDAQVTNLANYPIGMFDDTVDGNGDPQHNSALFRTDLAAPWGSEGTLARLDNFSNLVYTALLDPTNITTTGGRAFLTTLGGTAAGNEIVDGYIQVLAATGVTGYPFLQAARDPRAGMEEAPLGLRVDNQKLLDMNAYLNSLPAPAGVAADPAVLARARTSFRINCTSCHNVDQGQPVPAFTVPMARIFPGDAPVTLLPSRTPPLNPILNTPGNIFDDKAAVVNASIRGGIRGAVMPLLLDLARKPNFLHDNSVPTLDNLFDPARGASAPHPFYITDPTLRAEMSTYMRSLDTNSR